MRWVRIMSLSLLGVLLLGGTFLVGYQVGDHGGAAARAAGPGFEILWRVRDLLSASFIGDVPPVQQQVYGAARGLASSYNDPFTVFVEPVGRKIEREELQGHFGGIGASLTRNEKGEVTLAVLPDRPAARAGVLDGDILLEVDGKAVTAEMTIQNVVELVRGDVGTTAKLLIRRMSQDAPLALSVVRERIDTPSVEWRLADPATHTGYLKVSLFTERTGEELKTGIADLAGKGVDKVVLDLRGNGGGLVDAAVQVVSQFLLDGTVLREQKRGGQERFYPVSGVKGPAQDWPIAVLVDGGTASASEIVAGSLRDNGRAVLIGEKTYGKGSVQEVHELPDGSSLHVTVARWFTPNRHQIDKTGLLPDVAVVATAQDRSAGRDSPLLRAEAWLHGDR